MKNTILLSILVLLVSSCKDDFDLAAPFKEIPVSYGFLNRDDTAHYIRLERAFIDSEIAPAEIALRPDSLYYTNAVVMLRDSNTRKSITLKRVNGENEGFPRKPGVFATSPNYLYKVNAIEFPLIVGNKIQLVFKTSPEATKEYIASTEVIADYNISAPNPSSLFEFIEGNVLAPRVITTGNVTNATIFDLDYVINYDEWDVANPGLIVKKTIVWPAVRGLTPTSLSVSVNFSSQRIQAQEFYRFLASKLNSNPSIRRLATDFDIVVKSSGPDYQKYASIVNTDLGLTSIESKPVYTNFRNGALGLFASRSSVNQNYIFGPETLDSLANGRFTRRLGFVK
jgi:hypothetical protein